MKRVLYSIFFVASLTGMELENTQAATALKLYKSNDRVYVQDDEAAYRVQPVNMNALMREVIQRNATSQFSKAGYIRINKLDEGQYQLLAKVRGEGGGAGGANAGFIFGKFLTYGVCHGAIYLSSCISGPAQPVASTAVHLTAHPYIEAASNKVGIICGLIGGILTGPA